jgi:uncharacterized membrane protein
MAEKNVEVADSDQPTRIRVRVEALSDLVFGLALSVGSLEFLSSPARNASGLGINLLFFAFSFFILVFTWLGYSRTMAILPRETDTSLYLNLLLLFLTAIEPYLFYVLVSSPSNSSYDADVASIFYALDVGGLFLVQSALSSLVIQEDRRNELQRKPRLNPIVVKRVRVIVNIEIAIGLLYMISTLPIFWVETPIGQARFIFWWSAFGFFFARRGRSARRAQKLEPSDKENISNRQNEVI